MNLHLIADVECQRWLDSIKAINRFVTDVVNVTALTEQHRHIQEFNNGSEYGSGISCLVLLSESHIAVHTSPQKAVLNLDVFSCREFDVNALSYLLRRYFKTKRVIRWEVLQRF